MDTDVVVVGAGVAGLACARALSRGGRRVIVVDKGRGVGGRCATRRLADGQPVDHGVGFLHGRDPGFLAALEEVPATRLEGWPRRVVGRGVPCQPHAFEPGERRLAFAEGVSAFPKHLARGLDVRLGERAVELGPGRVRLESGAELASPEVVVTLPVEQLRTLLPVREETRAAHTLLDWTGTAACLTVLATWRRATPDPDFDVAYPDHGPLKMVLHDSAKGRGPARVLVLQATTRWSREHLDDDPTTVGATLLRAAADRFGAWAGEPDTVDTHRWRHARLVSGSGFGGPLRVPWPGGHLGLAGEAFWPVGGVEGAFCSGERLAQRILGVRP